MSRFLQSAPQSLQSQQLGKGKQYYKYAERNSRPNSNQQSMQYQLPNRPQGSGGSGAPPPRLATRPASYSGNKLPEDVTLENIDRGGQRQQKALMILLLVILGVALIVCVVLGIHFMGKSAKSQIVKPNAPDNTTNVMKSAKKGTTDPNTNTVTATASIMPDNEAGETADISSSEDMVLPTKKTTAKDLTGLRSESDSDERAALSRFGGDDSEKGITRIYFTIEGSGRKKYVEWTNRHVDAMPYETLYHLDQLKLYMERSNWILSPKRKLANLCELFFEKDIMRKRREPPPSTFVPLCQGKMKLMELERQPRARSRKRRGLMDESDNEREWLVIPSKHSVSNMRGVVLSFDIMVYTNQDKEIFVEEAGASPQELPSKEKKGPQDRATLHQWLRGHSVRHRKGHSSHIYSGRRGYDESDDSDDSPDDGKHHGRRRKSSRRRRADDSDNSDVSDDDESYDESDESNSDDGRDDDDDDDDDDDSSDDFDHHTKRISLQLLPPAHSAVSASKRRPHHRHRHRHHRSRHHDESEAGEACDHDAFVNMCFSRMYFRISIHHDEHEDHDSHDDVLDESKPEQWFCHYFGYKRPVKLTTLWWNKIANTAECIIPEAASGRKNRQHPCEIWDELHHDASMQEIESHDADESALAACDTFFEVSHFNTRLEAVHHHPVTMVVSNMEWQTKSCPESFETNDMEEEERTYYFQGENDVVPFADCVLPVGKSEKRRKLLADNAEHDDTGDESGALTKNNRSLALATAVVCVLMGIQSFYWLSHL